MENPSFDTHNRLNLKKKHFVFCAKLLCKDLIILLENDRLYYLFQILKPFGSNVLGLSSGRFLLTISLTKKFFR